MSAIFAHGLGAPEGPVARPDGSLLVTEMSSHRQCISRVDRDGNREVVHHTGGRPNGLTVDGDDNLWIAEAGLRALICVAPDGIELLRLEEFEGRRFGFPNDVAFGPDGQVYMTDSGLAVTEFLDGQSFVDDYESLPWDGRVFEIDPKRGTVTRCIDRGMRFTNGIAFDAAGILYANESFTGDVFRYDVFGSGGGTREKFGNVLQPDDREGFKGPDGMAFGADGRLYCTVYGQRNITVLDRDGSVAERLALTGHNPTNCAFATTGRTLLVTEVGDGRIEALPVPCDGLALHMPRLGLRG